MVAVMEDRPKRLRFEDSAVRSDLKYWGYHKGKQLAAEGYPIGRTVKEMLAHDDSARPTYSVLVKDMPAKAWRINAIIMQLPDHLIEVLVGRYCLPCKENGQPYDSGEIADAIGLTKRTYFRHLNEARNRYKSLIFGY